MTLAFMQQFPKGIKGLEGKPTHFVEKIWQSFPDEVTTEVFSDQYLPGLEKVGYDFNIDAVDMAPKLHTMRRDENDRWKAGNDIHFYINSRTPEQFQFAPVIPCVSTQKVEIKHVYPHRYIFIDGRYISDFTEKHKLAINDGFDSVEDFLAYFNSDWVGKLIHWTDLKY